MEVNYSVKSFITFTPGYLLPLTNSSYFFNKEIVSVDKMLSWRPGLAPLNAGAEGRKEKLMNEQFIVKNNHDLML